MKSSLQLVSFLLLLLPLVLSSATEQSGVITRTTHQQLLASIPSGESASHVLFLTSPAGKYAATFIRTPTAPAAGGFGNDFCLIQVTETSTEQVVWESECTPISTSNSCSLVFTDDGLAVFDGSQSQWDTGAESADNNPLETVELVDEGDMRIRDKIGELAWRASEDPRVNQRCGEPGSPGLAPALPPFAEPIGGGNGGDSSIAFGQQQQQGSGGYGVFDNGSSVEEVAWSMASVVVACWVLIGVVF